MPTACDMGLRRGVTAAQNRAIEKHLLAKGVLAGSTAWLKLTTKYRKKVLEGKELIFRA